MQYEVIHRFKDLKDNGHIYNIGDKYPRKGKSSKTRIEELLDRKNKLGKPVIIEVGEDNE